MKIVNLTQGSPEWVAHRSLHLNASDAPAMMGASPYTTRSALMRVCAGGAAEEITASKQILFDRGHATEAAIRPHIESVIGEDLYPVIGVSDEHPKLSASFDGLTMAGDVVFEHKQFSADLFAAVQRGEIGPEHYWQLEHQLLVSGAKKVIFVVSDGTPERCATLEYLSQPGRRAALVSGWKQFERDLADFKPAAAVVEAVGRAPETLPALHIEVTGMVKSSNLALFKETALAVFKSISTELATDTDFANAEKTIKWCADVEDRLKAAKQHALSQTASIDELFRAIDAISEEARAKRLELDKLVKIRKEAIRFEITGKASDAFKEHCAAINIRLGKVTLPPISDRFGEVIKGKKSITSIQDAVDAELARLKIEANAIGERMDANLRTLRELASDHKSLFMDAQQLALKDNADLVAVIKSRIADAQAEATRRAEAARETIRLEEAAKLAAAQPAPTPAPVAPPPVAAPPAPAARGKSPARPSDLAIATVLADWYKVPAATIYKWIPSLKEKA